MVLKRIVLGLLVLTGAIAFALRHVGAQARASETIQAAPDGAAVYQRRCASCHESANGRTPTREALQGLTATRILRSLDFGVMMSMAYQLRRDERDAVARFLGRAGDEPGPRAEAFCDDRTVRIDNVSKASWNGWSPSTDNTRFVDEERAKLSAADVPRLQLRWAFGFEGDVSAFAQPTVIGNQVFVGSAGGMVHALRASSGCLQWVYQAHGPIRSAIVAAPIGSKHVVLFGDLTGWFYALDAETGKELWTKRPEPHEAARLSAPPVVYQDTVFIPAASWEETRSLNPEYPCCTFRGSLMALRLSDGREVWKTYTVPERPEAVGKTAVGTPMLGPSGVGIWSSPTIDLARGRMYVTTGNNYSAPATDTSDAVMALELKTGRIVWTRQGLTGDAYNSSCGGSSKGPSCPQESGPDHDFGSPALLVTTRSGRQLLLAGQKSGVVWAFDPARDGAVVWQTRIGRGGVNGGIQWGMASDGALLFATVSDAIIRTGPTGRSLDPTIGGGLTALRVEDGSRAWTAEPAACGAIPNCSPAQPAAVTAIPGVVFAGSLDGHLRAYSAADGKIVWDFNTAREFETVNGVKATGGAIDGPGATVVNGMVLVNSGYSRQGGMPGNVLLMFSAQP